MHLTTLTLALLALSACTYKPMSPKLPLGETLGTARNSGFARVQTHFHGPFSYDACDDHGLQADGTPTPTCIRDVRFALCYNHIDVAFFTDHLSHVGDYPFAALLLSQTGDTPIQTALGKIIGNEIHCEDGFKVHHFPSFEGNLLALGIENQPSLERAERDTIFGGGSKVEKQLLEEKSHALIGIPHTEGKKLNYLETLDPNFIEIFNLHAQFDVNRRRNDLHLSPFSHFPSLAKYLIDPFHWSSPDTFFLDFLEFNGKSDDVYFSKWNAMLAHGHHVTGTGAIDSHQNVMKFKGADGERLDSHRRLTRVLNNLVLVKNKDPLQVKEAIRRGRVVVTLEGLGSPQGFDFYAKQDSKIFEMGDEAALNKGPETELILNLPHLHPESAGAAAIQNDTSLAPSVFAEIHFIENETGKDEVILTSKDPEIRLKLLKPGHYRAHIFIVPHHLKSGDQSYLWMVTNPILIRN